MKKLYSILLAGVLMLSCFTLVACGKAPKEFDVAVNVWYAQYGYASGGGTFVEGDEVTIYAEPSQNSTFVAWLLGDVIASYEQNYTFEMSAQTQGTYTAVFECPKLELVKLTKVEYTESYNTQTALTETTIDLKIGSNFNNTNQILNQVLNRNSTEYSEFVNNVALDYRNKLCITLNMKYTYNIVENEEQVPTTLEKLSYFETQLTYDNLVTEEFTVEMPTTLEGSGKLKLHFEVLEWQEPEKAPEEGAEQE
ncbi:MAG: hypothetical protein IJA69_00270 [Clostridia bacterium]|nr:hypothetical protein [Clostridia bacterium]